MKTRNSLTIKVNTKLIVRIFFAIDSLCFSFIALDFNQVDDTSGYCVVALTMPLRVSPFVTLH